MDTIKVDMENLSEEEREQLLRLIEKSNQSKSKVWKPDEFETYWYVTDNGQKACKNWVDGGISYTDMKFSIGNCFKTKEEAEFAVEKLKVIAELKRFAEENNERKLEWPGRLGCENVGIFYDCCNGRIDTYGWTESLQDLIYFSSHKIANEAIKTIGADRLKKYYFGIED